MTKEFIDEDNVDGVQYFSRKQAIKNIKKLLVQDVDLLGGRDISKISDNDILEIGFNHYGIYKL